MSTKPVLSICLPCYGRVDYVRNTLLSIYVDNSEVPLEKFEVVISDNDPNKRVYSLMREFSYSNLRYHYSNCEGFLNSYCVLKYGIGDLLKLHNSQVVFRKGSLRAIINEVERVKDAKPLIFYSNGFLNDNRSMVYYSFDEYCNHLSYWPSWSNGFSIWKEDFDRLSSPKLNTLFPHVSLFNTQHDKMSYISNDIHLFETQRVKGRKGHNKFEAFTIEYPSLVDECYQNGWISKNTEKKIFNDIVTEYLPTLLFNKYIARIEFYDISGYRTNIKKYFSSGAYWKAWIHVLTVPYKMIIRKVRQALS